MRSVLPVEVRTMFDNRGGTLPQSYVACLSEESFFSRSDECTLLSFIHQISKVFDNKFMVGVGEASKFRLSLDWGVAAFNLLLDKLDAGQAMTAAQFASDICRPLKASEGWCKSQISTFGRVAASSGSFQLLA